MWEYLKVIIEAFLSGAPGDVPWEDWVVEPLASLMYTLSEMWEYAISEVFWGVHIMILVGIIHLIITKRRRKQ